MTYDETKIEIAKRFTRYAERFDTENQRYKAAGSSANAQPNTENRKAATETGGYAFIAAQGVLMELRAMAQYFRLSKEATVAEMQAACEAAYKAHEQDSIPDVRKTAILASEFNTKWLGKLQTAKAWKSA